MDMAQWVPVILALIMFSMGLSLKTSDFLRILSQPGITLLGLSCQLLLLPLCAWGIGMVLGLSDELQLGLLLLALCPGGITSNLASKYAGGDVALSVSLTAFSSLLTVPLLPLILNFAASSSHISVESFSLPVRTTITQLTILTILPVAVAMACNILFPAAVNKHQRKVLYLATLGFIIIIASTWLQQWHFIVQSARQIGLAVISLNLLTMLLGWYAGKLLRCPVKQKISLVLEIGLQNSALAFTVAFSLIANSALAIPSAFYSVVMVCSALLIILISRYSSNNNA